MQFQDSKDTDTKKSKVALKEPLCRQGSILKKVNSEAKVSNGSNEERSHNAQFNAQGAKQPLKNSVLTELTIAKKLKGIGLLQAPK